MEVGNALKALAVGAGIVLIPCAVLLGLWFTHPVPPIVERPIPIGAPVGGRVVLLAYTDPYGGSAPGGAPVVGSDDEGTAVTNIGNAWDGLDSVPVVFLLGIAGLLPLMWGIRWVIGFFQ